MKFTTKINKIFNIVQSKEVQGAEIWLVHWIPVGDYELSDYWKMGNKVSKAFFNEDDAKAFKKSLLDANKLLHNKNNIHCTIEKQE